MVQALATTVALPLPELPITAITATLHELFCLSESYCMLHSAWQAVPPMPDAGKKPTPECSSTIGSRLEHFLTSIWKGLLVGQQPNPQTR